MYSGCTEYDWQKNRTFIYDGKTARRKNFRNSSELNSLVKKNININRLKVENNTFLPVTCVDSCFSNLDYLDKVLRKKHLWSTVLDELENKCINKTSLKFRSRNSPYYYNNGNRVNKITYDIPVIGHIMISNNIPAADGIGDCYSKNYTNSYRWLCWKGKYYDPNYLYYVSSNDNCSSSKLKKVCANWHVPAQFEMNPLIRPLSFTIHQQNSKNKNKNGYKIPSAFNYLYKHALGDGVLDYYSNNINSIPMTNDNMDTHSIILDMQELHHVTHIGIRSGGGPIVSTFPHEYYGLESIHPDPSRTSVYENRCLQEDINEVRSYKDSFRNRRFGRSRRWGNGILNKDKRGYVYIIPNVKNLSYMMSFELYYKERKGSSWIRVNSSIQLPDSYTSTYGIQESVISLKELNCFTSTKGVYCRYIKIVPKIWHIEPSYQVMVYGIKGTVATNAYTATTANNNNGNGNIDMSTLPIVETVSYSMEVVDSSKHWLYDGEIHRYRDWDWECRQNEYKRRYIRDEMKCFDT